MGYKTTFTGELTITPPLSVKFIQYLRIFVKKRHFCMKQTNSDLGTEGEFSLDLISETDDNVLDYNKPPGTQPSLWCDWFLSNNGARIYPIDGNNYRYAEWLIYLNEHFFTVMNNKLSGQISWQGEHHNDHGIIQIDNGIIHVEPVLPNPYIEEYLRLEKLAMEKMCSNAVVQDRIESLDQLICSLQQVVISNNSEGSSSKLSPVVDSCSKSSM
jgi:hypothetical protein